MYELSTIHPEISGILPVRMGAAVCPHGGRRAVHRSAPEFPASPVCIRRRQPRRDRRISRQPPAPSPSPRRSRRRGRSVRFQQIMPVDLLVFGPHPDDIEIGLGGTVARHARGARVGLCDLTAGEMGSNGTVEERLAEAEAARLVLGAVWRHNLRWPDRRIGSEPGRIEEAAALHSPPPAAGGGDSLLVGSPSGPHRRQPGADRGGVQRRLATLHRPGRGVETRVDLLLLHQRPAEPSFVVDISDTTI